MIYNCKIICEKDTEKGTYFSVLVEGRRVKDKLEKYGDVMDGELRIDDGRLITSRQRKAIYATIKDIAIYSGDVPERIKEILKYYFMIESGCLYFSLSNCDVTTARDYLTYLLDFCIKWGIPLSEKAVERTDDIDAYLWSCLHYRKCAICGRNGEIHHVDTIGMGHNRKRTNDSEKRKICLCREHHTAAHTLGRDTFEQRYKVKGVIYNEK